MATDSKIEWTHHTFNPWRGCTKVSDGCKHCYAETLSGRNPKTLGVWGPRGTRVIAAESYWREPLKWQREAKAAGERRRVFCASLADIFEGDDTMPAESRQPVANARQRLWDLIYATPDLDWLLLTKRPENIIPIVGGASGAGVACLDEIMPNVWLGTSVENQAAADQRIPHLLKCPAAVRFLSCEPLLGPVDLRPWLGLACFERDYIALIKTIPGGEANVPAHLKWNGVRPAAPAWVIVGGESGPGARPFDCNWARSIVGQCKAAGVAVFVKQLGAAPFNSPFVVNDRKGGEMSEWPADLRVREFPEIGGAR